jgi:heptaprenyl diphosphate synthase
MSPAPSTQRITRLAFLSAAGIALYVLESFIPTPLPFLKIGLANASSLAALMLYSPLDMLLVVVTRVLVGSFLVGSLFSPAFLLGLCGGIVAALAMIAAKGMGSGLFSVIGISLIGSVAHIITQLVVVMYLFVENESLLVLLPILLTTAVVGGLIVGWVSLAILKVMKSR